MKPQTTTKTLYTMNNGLQIPSIGFGTYQLTTNPSLETALTHAYQSGYRLIDTATMYTNEKLIGDAILHNNIPRSSLFLTTKIWMSDMTYTKAKASITRSLQNLNTDYIDLVLIHWPIHDKQQHLNVWKALEESVHEGKVRSIGVSNFKVEHLEHLLHHCNIKPVINQIECHPCYYDKQTINYCKTNNILIEAYCPLAQFNEKLIKHPKIINIAKRVCKSVPQVILKWHLINEIIPLPKSSHSTYIKDNITLDDFDLTKDDMDVINNIGIKYKRY